MTSQYRREHLPNVRNDELTVLATQARDFIESAASSFEAVVDNVDAITPSSGERLALRRAMARFIIDSGIASARGWI